MEQSAKFNFHFRSKLLIWHKLNNLKKHYVLGRIYFAETENKVKETDKKDEDERRKSGQNLKTSSGKPFINDVIFIRI